MKKSKIVELTLKVPWGHIAAKAQGDEKNQRVLMVHGILDNAGSFDRLIALLPNNFYYVAIDLPGHGLSSHLPSGTTLNYLDYVLTIKYVLDELGWENCYYIGHSLGAHLGLYFTLVYPGKIRKLVQLEGITPAYYENEDLIHIIRREQNIAMEKHRNASRVYTKEEIMFALVNLRQCTLNTKAAEAIFERAVTKVGDDEYSYNRDYRAKTFISFLQNKDLCIHFMKQAKVETLTIVADNGLPFLQKIRKTQCETIKNMSNFKLLLVKGNHDVHNNNPERVSQHICNFLNQIPSKL